MDVLDQGEGPALLLLHGFPLDRRIWEAQLEPLATGARVVAPDLPGFGGSPLAPPPASLDDYARALLEALDSRRIDRVAVAGHSMGGYIAFALHRLAPRRLSGLALVSSRAAADSPEGRKAREETAQRALREGPGFLAETMPARVTADGASPELLGRLERIMRASSGAGIAAASRAMASRPDATPELASLRVPTVIFAGRKDKVVPPAESESMAKAIPGAKLVWCERSGHMPMMEEPGLVTAVLKSLVAGR
jgi:pimeloyl-ACP methyl ester carboxylesterase